MIVIAQRVEERYKRGRRRVECERVGWRRKEGTVVLLFVEVFCYFSEWRDNIQYNTIQNSVVWGSCPFIHSHMDDSVVREARGVV